MAFTHISSSSSNATLKDAVCDIRTTLSHLNLLIFFLVPSGFVITLFIYSYLFILSLLNTKMEDPGRQTLSIFFHNFVSYTWNNTHYKIITFLMKKIIEIIHKVNIINFHNGPMRV